MHKDILHEGSTMQERSLLNKDVMNLLCLLAFHNYEYCISSFNYQNNHKWICAFKHKTK